MNGLALVESPDHVCCRYRVRAFLPALEAAGCRLRIEGLSGGPAARAAQLLRCGRFDFVLLQRKLLPGWQWRLLRSRARRVIFDFDDAVLYRDSYDPRGPHCPRRARRFARAARQADLVLAGNAFLAEQARRSGAGPSRVRVVPTCVDTARLAPSGSKPPGSGLTLAWIGSSSTLKGLEGRRSLFARLGRELPGVTLRVICDRFPRFDGLAVEPVPWSAATEAEALRSADAGISVVPDDLWSRGKCGLKVLQYLASGLPVVTNPVGVHREMIRDGVEGFLATTDEEWIRAVRVLLEDPRRRAEMGRAARATAAGRYSIGVWQGEFVRAVVGDGERGTRAAHARSDRIGKNGISGIGNGELGIPGAGGAAGAAPPLAVGSGSGRPPA